MIDRGSVRCLLVKPFGSCVRLVYRGGAGDVGAPLQVMAKIEKPQAVQDLDEIVELCDAIMVAR